MEPFTKCINYYVAKLIKTQGQTTYRIAPYKVLQLSCDCERVTVSIEYVTSTMYSISIHSNITLKVIESEFSLIECTCNNV